MMLRRFRCGPTSDWRPGYATATGASTWWIWFRMIQRKRYRAVNGIQLIGSAYDRRIYGYAIATSKEQDDALIAEFNDRTNRSHFDLFFNNCANFAANVMNYYYPHSIRRNFIADTELMTPKDAAKSLVKYEKKHPEIDTASFVIEQVPGTIPRSTPVDGISEALLKSKKYVLPITLLQSFAAAGLAVVYLGGGGRFHPDPHATVFDARRDAVPSIPSGRKTAAGSGAASALAGDGLFESPFGSADYRVVRPTRGEE
jgi:hypothetical protein